MLDKLLVSIPVIILLFAIIAIGSLGGTFDFYFKKPSFYLQKKYFLILKEFSVNSELFLTKI